MLRKTGAASGLLAGVLALQASFVCAASAPLPTPDEIVARYVAARGGLAKLRGLRSLRQTGRVTAGAGRTALVTREVARPGKIRFEFTVQGKTAVYASDGTHGWQVSPFGGDMAQAPLTAEALIAASEQADLEGPLVDWKAKGHRLELAGRETIGGREAFKLVLTQKNGAVRHEYIDAATMRHVRSESTREIRGRAVRLLTTFADFRKSGGLLFPHRIEVSAAERPARLLVVVDKVEVNPPLAAARFEAVPAASAKPDAFEDAP